MENTLVKTEEEINEERLNEAKELVAKSEEVKLNEAIKKFHEFKKQWSAEYGVDLIVSGKFSGSQIHSGIQIIKIK